MFFIEKVASKLGVVLSDKLLFTSKKEKCCFSGTDSQDMAHCILWVSYA